MLSCLLRRCVRRAPTRRFPAHRVPVRGRCRSQRPADAAHISLEEAKAFASSILKGDVDALGVLKQTVKDIAARARR